MSWFRSKSLALAHSQYYAMLDNPSSSPSSALGNNRLLSLDAFRGLTIAGMILVNDPGSWAQVYAPLRHAEWNGCTPTDLVFPFFVFIVGVSMYFSLRRFDHRLSWPTAVKILRRTLLIFALGLFLTWFPFYHKPFAEYRIMNVLQRIALAYGAAAFIGILTPQRWLWRVIGSILLAYWALMYFFGGEEPYSLEDNFARMVDLALLGPSHLYGGFGLPFDPEGLLHSLPAVATALLGFQAGRLIVETPDRERLVRLLLLYGIGGVALGLFWGLGFPINKPLWSSSYVVYTAGLAACLLGVCMEYYDLYGGKRGKFFLEVFGTNALFAYVLHGLLYKISSYLLAWPSATGDKTHPLAWVYHNLYAQLFGDNPMASLLYAMSYVLLIWGFTYLLYRRKIFIKL
ncbi:MAG: DUF5009 domain-containing protein [Lewinella sp.]|nr:DUF5009 domain-containing protein [Lewinella sp.]